LARANLNRVDLREGMLMEATNGHLEHSHADKGTVMAGANARGAMLRSAKLSNSVLKRADLREGTDMTACIGYEPARIVAA
jgi:uncharacterized protein YjbI with pentapeptide repeats